MQSQNVWPEALVELEASGDDVLIGQRPGKLRHRLACRWKRVAELACSKVPLDALGRDRAAVAEVGGDKIRVNGDEATLAAVIAGRQTGVVHVRGFVRKWRT